MSLLIIVNKVIENEGSNMAVILLLGVMFSGLILFISTIAYLYDFDLSGHESEFQDLLELFVDL